jgi:Ni/Fe-hydrogenase subunit HybB-like protein
VLIDIAMWVKCFVIVIATLEVPLMPVNFEFGTYTPSWVEISIIAAGFAGFILILALFTKVMPLMSFVEMTEEAEEEKEEEELLRLGREVRSER